MNDHPHAETKAQLVCRSINHALNRLNEIPHRYDDTDFKLIRDGIAAAESLAEADHERDSITLIVVALGAWGKGLTYEEALARCAEAGGRRNAADLHVVYVCTDPECTVNDRGGIEYRHWAVNLKIMTMRHNRVVKP